MDGSDSAGGTSAKQPNSWSQFMGSGPTSVLNCTFFSVPFYPYKDAILQAISAARRRSSKGSITSASLPSLMRSAAA